ncbi:hypothetical protein J6590_094613, partial [Homalodisca vitripennis]
PVVGISGVNPSDSAKYPLAWPCSSAHRRLDSENSLRLGCEGNGFPLYPDVCVDLWRRYRRIYVV